jgi:hypothetical protein
MSQFLLNQCRFGATCRPERGKYPTPRPKYSEARVERELGRRNIYSEALKSERFGQEQVEVGKFLSVVNEES